MKFKDKDGNVFGDILLIRKKLCSKLSDCRDCELSEYSTNCLVYCVRHPAAAARLMGYEVVEGNRVESDTVKVVEIDQVKPIEIERVKEADMDKQKPRICEVLGVEEDVPFMIKGCPGAGDKYAIFHNKKLRTYHPDKIIYSTNSHIGNKIGSNTLYWLFEHPESIIRPPRFTEEEAADAKVLCRALGPGWLARDDDFVLCHYKKEPKLSGGEFCANGFTVFIQEGMFPSIRPGQSVKLADIIGDAP